MIEKYLIVIFTSTLLLSSIYIALNQEVQEAEKPPVKIGTKISTENIIIFFLNVTFIVRLVENVTNKGIPNKNITLSIYENNNWVKVNQTLTDLDGKAVISYIVKPNIPSADFRIGFTGDFKYESTFKVEKIIFSTSVPLFNILTSHKEVILSNTNNSVTISLFITIDWNYTGLFELSVTGSIFQVDEFSLLYRRTVFRDPFKNVWEVKEFTYNFDLTFEIDYVLSNTTGVYVLSIEGTEIGFSKSMKIDVTVELVYEEVIDYPTKLYFIHNSSVYVGESFYLSILVENVTPQLESFGIEFYFDDILLDYTGNFKVKPFGMLPHFILGPLYYSYGDMGLIALYAELPEPAVGTGFLCELEFYPVMIGQAQFVWSKTYLYSDIVQKTEVPHNTYDSYILIKSPTLKVLEFLGTTTIGNLSLAKIVFITSIVGLTGSIISLIRRSKK
jgi:5-hydroxyisourate hydrolase-like protein (transthyretin family)